MLLEHMSTVVLHLLNSLKYLPELIVINVGTSDFTRFSNSQQTANIKYMVQACKALTQKVECQLNNFRDLFLNLMVSLPWYIGWRSQRVAHRVGSHFNGRWQLLYSLPRCLHGQGALRSSESQWLVTTGSEYVFSRYHYSSKKGVQALPGSPRG